MTVNEAYSRIKSAHPIDRLVGCFDFGKFFLFSFAPPNTPEGEVCFTGTVFEAVNKKDGRIFLYDILDNPDAYLKAKKVMPTNYIWNRKV